MTNEDPRNVPERRPGTGSESVRSVARALDLIDLVCDLGGEASLNELAGLSRLPASSAHRLLHTCIAYGYLRQTPTHRYALGPRLQRLGDAAGQQAGRTARPRLRELVDQLGESVSLAVRDGDHVVYVAEQTSRHAMRVTTEVGRRASLHGSGAGKAILATLDDEEIRTILARTGLPARTPRTLRTMAALLADVDQSRSRGYSVDDEEGELAVRCYAVAVPRTASPMALSVSAPVDRISTAFATAAVTALRSTAVRISGDLAAS